MFYRTLKKYGVKGATIIINLGASAISLIITLLISILSGENMPLFAFVMAILMPLILGTPIGYFHFKAMEVIAKSKEELALANLKLERALSEVKELSGLLPICSFCKRIRDDKGYWNQLESYIRDHSKAEFSHSFCPDCAEKAYPEFFKKNKGVVIGGEKKS
jgi:hypothetical protein